MQTRRQFLRTGAPFAGAVILAPELIGISSAAAKPLRGGKFTEGVISGDPSTNSIMLWTRVDGVGAPGTVELEVATDKGFRKVVARKNIKTSAAKNHTVKAKVGGLKPHEDYFYRFATKGEDSPVGRFRTALPADSNETVRFAFFSCADYVHGYYNGYERMANEQDLDFVLCLGDYIYDETYHTVEGGTAVRDDKIGRAPAEGYDDVFLAAHTLADYRKKYELYRSDKSLQKMHAKFPMVVVWDDHEVQNNYAGKPEDGGLPANEEYTKARQKAGYKAFYENMPTAPRGGKIYKSLKYGKNCELFVMDQRQYRDNQPCDDAVAPPCEDWNQPRDFLGRAQMDWVKSALQASRANWKIMLNELMVMPAKVTGGSFYTYDMWHGYPQERMELLTHIVDKGVDDVIFVTGDIHTFITGDVKVDLDGAGESMALEFVGGSITSQCLGETDLDAGSGIVIKGNDAAPNTDPAIIDLLRGFNPHVDQADFDHHGYGVMSLSSKAMDVDFRRLQTIKEKNTALVGGDDFKYHVVRGQKSIKGQRGPAAA